VTHVDLEAYGIMHKPLPIPLSFSPIVTADKVKMSPEQVQAEMFHNLRVQYESWLYDNRPEMHAVKEAFLASRPLITASYKVFNEAEFLPYSLASIYPWVDRIDIIEGVVQLRANESKRGSSTDGTLRAIKKFPDPNKKIRVLRGKWTSKEQIQAKLLEICNSKWMLFIDGDEIVEGMDVVREFCEASYKAELISDYIYARPERFLNFWHDFKHVAYSLNPLSPWAKTGLPHPFLIWRDIPGLNFGAFHTVPTDGFGIPIHSDEKSLRSRRKILDGVTVYHFGNAKDKKQVAKKLEFEKKRGVNWPLDGKGNPIEVEDDPWMSGRMPEDMRLVKFKGVLPAIMKSHPRYDETRIKITRKRPTTYFKVIKQ